MMSTLDCELHRLRVTRAMKSAIKTAAELEGISEAAWRKRVIALALIAQLGGGWMREGINDAQEMDGSGPDMDAERPDGGDGST